MSIEGYSFGVTALDVIGSAANSLLYFVRALRPRLLITLYEYEALCLLKVIYDPA